MTYDSRVDKLGERDRSLAMSQEEVVKIQMRETNSPVEPVMMGLINDWIDF